jgi:ATP-dependent Clp protease ATP-binding subunit ClpX
MPDLMYELPSQKNVQECLINEDFILKHAAPILKYETVEDVAWDKPGRVVQQ